MDSLLNGGAANSRFSRNLDEAFSAVEILNQTIVENANLRIQLSELELENQDLKNRLQKGLQALRQLASHVLGEHEFRENNDEAETDDHSPKIDKIMDLDEKYSVSDQIVSLQKKGKHGRMVVNPNSTAQTVKDAKDTETVQTSLTAPLIANSCLVTRLQRLQPVPLSTNLNEKGESSATTYPLKIPTRQLQAYKEQIAWEATENSLWRDGILEDPVGTKPAMISYQDFNRGRDSHAIYLMGLPKETDLRYLCSSLRGGRIHRIFLYNSGSHKNAEALVAFVKPEAARELYRNIQRDGFHINGHTIKAPDVLSERVSDYQVTSTIQTEIMETGLTRCLILSNLPRVLTAQVIRSHIEEDTSQTPDKRQTPIIESIFWDRRINSIRLNMAGIYLAQNVKSSLKRKNEYRAVRIAYARDPCEVDKLPALDRVLPKAVPLTSPLPRTIPVVRVSPLKIYNSALLSTPNPNPQCRKVVFAHLPPTSTLSSFAQNIRGGIVESLYFYNDKTGKIPKAEVVFREPRAAWCCYLYFKTIDPVFSGGKASLVPFENVLLHQQSANLEYIPPTARRSVRLNGLPRSADERYLINDIKDALGFMLKHNYAGRSSELLEGLKLDEYRRGASILFSQIKVAQSVVKRLKTNKNYNHCNFSFEKDPCEEKIEELFPEDKPTEAFDDQQHVPRALETGFNAGVDAKDGGEGSEIARAANAQAILRVGPPSPLDRGASAKTVRFAQGIE